MLVVFNPKSGQGESGLSEFVEHLRAAGAEVTERELAEGVPMQDYVRDLSQFDVLVGAGGDGTVSSLAYAARGQDVPSPPAPTSTSNWDRSRTRLRHERDEAAQPEKDPLFPDHRRRAA